jgi:hypothetical protein
MASSSKPGFVHFTLIFFVMLSIILGVLTYITYRDMTDGQAKLAKIEGDLKTEQNLARTQFEEISALKKLLSNEFDEQYPVGFDDQNNRQSVLGRSRADMFALAGQMPDGQPVPDMLKALQKLRLDVDSLTEQNNALQANLDSEVAQRESLRQQHARTLLEARNAQNKAESELAGLITKKEEEIEVKDAKITQLEQDYNQLQLEAEQTRETLVRVEKEKDNEISTLLNANGVLRERLQGIERVSFEVADGLIDFVDSGSKLVWLNLGSADRLQEKTTFSVYTKSHSGIGRDGEHGRGPEDIKGSIEVTKILGPHASVARVITEDFERPISKGDPIYTSLWSPGRSLAFSLVGRMDLDGDGRSNRKELHELIRIAGGTVDNEVDDEGNRTGDGISVNTKFLVIGELPDPTLASSPDEQAMFEKVRKAHADMEKEAHMQGVRVVSLNNFLSFVGYKPQRRLFVPGEPNRAYTLRGGADVRYQKALGRSSGQVSGAVGRGANVPRQQRGSSY